MEKNTVYIFSVTFWMLCSRFFDVVSNKCSVVLVLLTCVSESIL